MANTPQKGRPVPAGTTRRTQLNRTSEIRKQAEGDYDRDEDDEEVGYDEDLAAKKAGMGCLISFLVVLGIIVGVLLFAYFTITAEIKGKNATATEAVKIDVSSTNASGSRLGEELEKLGMIGNKTVFRFYVRFGDSGKGFQQGRFVLKPGMSYDEIIETISAKPPKRDTVRVTFPEGSTVPQFGAVLEKAGICTAEAFVKEANTVENYLDIGFFSKIEFDPDTYMKAEGYLAPNTYDFFVDEEVTAVVRKLYEQFDEELNSLTFTAEDGTEISLWQKLEAENRTLRDVVALASIVEEEAGDPENQPIVAGVFWNRLTGEGDDIPRTLGSDVTFYYIRDWIARDYEGDYKKVPSNLFYAYYTADDDAQSRVGVPAGPISCPSKTAIAAALAPEQHDYYYFLTDFYGKYYYAKEYWKHEQNVATMKRENAKFEQEQANASGSAAEG